MAAITAVSFSGGVSAVSFSSVLFHRKSTPRLASFSSDRLAAARLVSGEAVDDSVGIIKRRETTENPYADVEHVRPDEPMSLSEILEEVKDFAGSDDGGPPRWFSPVECRERAPGSPLLLFLPGIDGTGLGLIRQHEKLGELFDVWCLHIPVTDRTPANELVTFIERRVRSENDLFPNRPIYLVGESVGACLAIDVAARNPDIDLVLILANPAMNLNNNMLQPLLGLLQLLPDGVPTLVENIFGVKHGDPFKAVRDTLANEFGLLRACGGQLGDFLAASAHMPTLARIFSKETLLWRLKMLKSASASAKSQIYKVKAQTQILLSGRDQWLENKEEVQRVCHVVPRCEVRNFEKTGPFLFLEEGIDLVTIIKASSFYRVGKSHDPSSDYILPTPLEVKQVVDTNGWLDTAVSPVVLSTLEDGTLVRSLAGIPSEGPVLFVGYHMLFGIELYPMVKQFLTERNIHLRGMAHPLMFQSKPSSMLPELQSFDQFRLMGAVPLSSFNFYKMLRSKSHVLMYPGGVREALHRKGEEYKLFWPEQPEFVRAASRFGAKIVPFGVVGEDDLYQLVLDYNDQMKIPFFRDFIQSLTDDIDNVRSDETSELSNQDFCVPGILPKIPGRFYYYFGKPIETAGKEEELKDKEKARELYLRVKSEVEKNMDYLKKKRESDPYRSLVARLMYQASHGTSSEIPTFDL